MSRIRPPRFAGRYYFADPGRLRAAVESYIEDSTSIKAPGSLVGLIVPHAPHTECGPIAGFAYKMLLTTPLMWDVVTMLAASRTAPMTTPALACDPANAYDLPTEPMRVDRALTTALQADGVPIAAAPDDEPVIETHLPFVQVTLGDVPVLPLRVPQSTPATQLDGAAARLGLVIAPANLPAGFEQPACDAIERLDAAFFVGDIAPSKPRGLSGLFGSKSAKPPASPDAAALALALHVARANGATAGKVLKRGGALAACVLVRQ
jgi:hypothetical protein